MATRTSTSNCEIFKVKEDGTIVRTDEINTQGNNAVLEMELLDIIEVNSYSKKLLAAYKARKIANKISKKKYGKQNYKEYVEMLMVKRYPKELEMAQFGSKYLFWLWFSIILTIVSFGFGIPISALLIWKIVVPTCKQIKELQK